MVPSTDAESARAARDNELVHLLHPDLVGTVRGKAVRVADLDAAIADGIRWTPANVTMTPQNVVADGNPFGARGEVRLHPDPETEVRIAIDDVPPLHLMLCDARDGDGAPWAACVRALLRRTLDDLEAETGLRVVAAFEHEFQLLPLADPRTQPYSLTAARLVEPFPSRLVEALDCAGIEPQMLIAEYGPSQYEITCAPAHGVAAADRALLVRAIVRELALRSEARATFSPITDPEGVGNGVHVHLSFVDRDGAPALADASRPSGLSETAGRFVAGVLSSVRGLIAFTAPSPISAIRLGPHRWSTAHAFLGRVDREALVRIPGQRPGAGGAELSIEFRAADAAAAPHLALAAIVRAGLAGVVAGLEEAPVVDEDIVDLDGDELARRGIAALPVDLEEALSAAGDAAGPFADWLPEPLWKAYLAVKRTELAAAEAEPGDVMATYRDFY